MTGHKQKKSTFFSFFKAKKCRKEQDSYPAREGSVRTRKVYTSEEDNILRVIAEPRIDKKASAFIANFHATRISEATLASKSEETNLQKVASVQSAETKATNQLKTKAP